MARKKRTRIQRERDLVEVASLYLRGHSQQSIVDDLNKKYYLNDPISRQQVGYDIRILIERWKKVAFREINERKAEELARVDNLEREYWDAWERSKLGTENSTTEKIQSDEVRLKVLLRKEGQIGDPRFLQGVQWCINKRCEILGLDAPKHQELASEAAPAAGPILLPAELIAASFIDVYRDIKDRRHMEYLLKGGRGSTKSSFASLAFICLIVNNPGIHGLALRQVANTLRDSVYSQLVWAIGMLGLADDFKCTSSPLEIEYKPTGQKIYFRGADKPEMIKSIKPTFGHIGILWFEELDQFHGPEAIRKIEQSVLRGGEESWEFKTYNPPRTAANWVNKYVQIPKANQCQHHSTYLDVPKEWLGQVFIDEAEHLQSVNPDAYKHEYLGEVVGTGGQVFENVQIRKITDEEIKQFDHILMGNDWGYYPDPYAWVKCHYDAGRLTLYIFDELRMLKAGNRETYNELVNSKSVTPNDLIISDSAEPKSIADYRDYGLNCRGAEKGPESVKYSMKWFQSLKAIVIDNQRCPYAAEEFLNYELEQDKDGNFISEYPDKNNHFIDGARYATNLIWRRRGQ